MSNRHGHHKKLAEFGPHLHNFPHQPHRNNLHSANHTSTLGSEIKQDKKTACMLDYKLSYPGRNTYDSIIC